MTDYFNLALSKIEFQKKTYRYWYQTLDWPFAKQIENMLWQQIHLNKQYCVKTSTPSTTEQREKTVHSRDLKKKSFKINWITPIYGFNWPISFLVTGTLAIFRYTIKNDVIVLKYFKIAFVDFLFWSKSLLFVCLVFNINEIFDRVHFMLTHAVHKRTPIWRPVNQ